MPRNHEGIALIGDPRTDAHLFTSQMTVAFIKLHNRLVDRLREDQTTEDALFEQARRAATWPYFLRHTCASLLLAEQSLSLQEIAGRWPTRSRSS